MTGADPYAERSIADIAALPTALGPGVFDGRVVAVTGGAGGIGRHICALFGRLGASIVACGRNEAKLDELGEGLRACGIDASTIVANIRDPEQAASFVEAAWSRHGRLDVVVNNAGGQFAAPALDISPRGWAAVVETNLYGTWYVMQAAAKRWAGTADGGCIVNIMTKIGHAAVGIAHTAASRAGAAGLTRALAVEWAPHHIRVNAVAVGVVTSPGLRNYPPEARPSFGHNPMRRLGDPHDVAQATAFLASDGAAFTTGALLHVDGGEDVWGEYWAIGKPDWFKVEYP